MVSRRNRRLLISPADLAARHDGCEVVGTFNPGVCELPNGSVRMLVRVAERPVFAERGWVALPRYEKGTFVIDRLRADDWELVDPRVIRHRATGRVRLTFVSYLRVIEFSDPLTLSDGTLTDTNAGVIVPVGPWEEYGVEDPRITFDGGRAWITYVAVSRHGPATALASTTDFRTFERHGIIFCVENKDVAIFPGKVDGRYLALHRPVGGSKFTTPEMWIATSPDRLHWGDHRPIVLPQSDWDTGRVGGGTPPIEFDDGWLEIYHGNRKPDQPGGVGEYCGGAIVLDRNQPERVISRSREPILKPETDDELAGFVGGVVFPTGVVRRDDSLFVYYGAADTTTAVVELSVDELRQTLVPMG